MSRTLYISIILILSMIYIGNADQNISCNTQWGCIGSGPPYYTCIDSASLCPDENLSYINLHSFQQQLTDYACGSAAIMTILSYYHFPVQYGSEDEMRISKELGTSLEYGTTPEMIVNYFQTQGWTVDWGNNGTLQLLRENIKNGRPTLVGWIDWGGHWTIVTGYDTRGTADPSDDVIIFADSVDRDDRIDGVTYFNARRFTSMWFNFFPDHSHDNQRVWITPIPPSGISSPKQAPQGNNLFEDFWNDILTLFNIRH